MKTSNLSGVALDWAVAKAKGLECFVNNGGTISVDLRVTPIEERIGDHSMFSGYSPSTNWEQGGPIVEREGIYLRAVRYEGHPLNGQWLAQVSDSNTASMVQWVKREDWKRHYYVGPTVLISAMRCYVASKFGDEIDIPEELK